MSEGYIIGGGGSALNFKVIAVASESALPSSAAENTIAVITTAPITSYVFSATAPTLPAEGMVWFTTGAASMVGFNAIKKNGLWVYPTGCQQYISGAWVSKTAKTYKNGAWVDWVTYLYNYGSTGYSFGTSHGGLPVAVVGSASEQSTYWILAVSGPSTAAALYTNSKINLTNYKKLTLRGRKAQNNANQCCMAVSNGNATEFYSNIVASGDIGYSTDDTNWSIDITSLTGEYYLGCFLWTNGAQDLTQLVMVQLFLG